LRRPGCTFFFDEGVPGAAVGATPYPSGGFVGTGLADVDGVFSGHGVSNNIAKWEKNEKWEKSTYIRKYGDLGRMNIA
jgi:hypothetical protein